ncbi:putative nwd2 protein [Mycena sanguinolenta]|uniref:Putative nwd2 protein n=1 Tax=Mycena sanguinolenta TaxID=230812 RepID=A0A8H6Z602_9AGAR|nr:putative nwd2 protein [Mycena sanguinolenta]
MKMLGDLRKWAMDPHPQTTILWLYGPAGAGKSAIMQTLAGQLQDAGRLCGCFFFKRGHATHGNGKTVFATLAYQLALNIPWLRMPISEAVESNPSVVALSLESQMQKLIFEPCTPHGGRDPLAIIIDGLDECDSHDVQQQILRAIRNASAHLTIPLRFFIASRPEPHIRESFEDIRKYLRDEFLRIHSEHRTTANIPLPWPSRDVLEQLVKNSSGYVIYASTIIKFIDDKSYLPTERLAVVQDPTSAGSESAFDTLDQLYITILASAPRQSQFIPILGAIIHLDLTAGQTDLFFALKTGETQLLLKGLHSVLSVPQDNEDRIRSHHASFVDFLKNPGRSGNFSVGTLNRRIGLARPLLQFHAGLMQRKGIFILSRSISFIVSFPPSDAVAELFPLIGSINPDYIFAKCQLRYDHFSAIVSWLKNTPSAPIDLIQLWEGYAFMFFIDTMVSTNAMISNDRLGQPDPSFNRSVSPSPELLRILISAWFLNRRLWELPTKLDGSQNNHKQLIPVLLGT